MLFKIVGLKTIEINGQVARVTISNNIDTPVQTARRQKERGPSQYCPPLVD